ncbi:hypothetical protein NG2371_00408 [Nocardia gamkensis]|nr:hypothetical protein [Nocardia gamkensis]
MRYNVIRAAVTVVAVGAALLAGQTLTTTPVAQAADRACTFALDCLPGVWQGKIVMRATWGTGTDEVRKETTPVAPNPAPPVPGCLPPARLHQETPVEFSPRIRRMGHPSIHRMASDPLDNPTAALHARHPR